MPDFGFYARRASPRHNGVATVTATIHNPSGAVATYDVLFFQQDEEDKELAPQKRTVRIPTDFPYDVHFETAAHSCHVQVKTVAWEESGKEMLLIEHTLPRRD